MNNFHDCRPVTRSQTRNPPANQNPLLRRSERASKKPTIFDPSISVNRTSPIASSSSSSSNHPTQPSHFLQPEDNPLLACPPPTSDSTSNTTKTLKSPDPSTATSPIADAGDFEATMNNNQIPYSSPLPDANENPPSPPPVAAPTIDENPPSSPTAVAPPLSTIAAVNPEATNPRDNIDLNIIDISSDDTPDGDEPTSVSVQGINHNPTLLNLLPFEPSRTNTTFSPHLNSENDRNPDKRPQNFPQSTRPIFSGHIGPMSRSTNLYYETGTSSRSHEKPTVNTTHLAQQPFIQQTRFGPLQAPPHNANPITSLPPLTGHPGSSPHISGTNDQNQLLPDLTPYQLHMLNQLARNAYPASPTKNSTFNFHPLGGVKRPSGMMINS